MKKRRIARLLVAVSMSLACTAHGQAVLINEVMALNGRTTVTGSGGYGDWIELRNPGIRSIEVGGMYLTDDLADPRKWQIPAGQTIRAGTDGYLVICADQQTTGSALHANFELSSEGDAVALFDRDGTTLIDKVTFGRQRADISYGRDPAAGNEWRFLGVPTPGKANTGAVCRPGRRPAVQPSAGLL